LLFEENSPSYPNRNIENVRTSTIHDSMNCRDVLQTTPLFFQARFWGDIRKGPSSFENMLFLHVEDALLETRRAYSQTLFVINWFIASYRHVINRHYSPLLRVFNLDLCNGFSIYQFLSSLQHPHLFTTTFHLTQIALFKSITILLTYFVQFVVCPLSPS